MLPSNDTLSNILGWVSIACWIVVYSPQLYENYVLQSGEGLSVLFVLIWLVGDLCNLSGAILAHLLPTVIILALYYSLCDLLLLVQIYYYRWKGSKSPRSSPQERVEERVPLLSEERVSPNTESGTKILLRYTGCLIFVFVVGVIAWWISSFMNQHPPAPPRDRSKSLTWTIQILGWTSAVLFLGARIPQIMKNFQTRCEGLTPALFFFAMFGNITYAFSICVKSMDKSYLITNASWLAGSALTVFLDAIVLLQIFYYRSHPLEDSRHTPRPE
ncbi:ybr147w-like protein [Moniliophthora roreri MCA 2997]|uniref:Ybr147w-like protein n=1 Tax=Moniliophthora roreri (strain MCA 2997) TaxID=1381753 RepID=V2X9M0_MONRO|nr:ybr147w-like protein [Moniliophthora roreri MCA 2997]